MSGYYDQDIKLYCPEPKMKSKALNILRPFSLQLWIAVLAGYVIASLSLVAIKKLQKILGFATDDYHSFFITYAVIFAEFK